METTTRNNSEINHSLSTKMAIDSSKSEENAETGRNGLEMATGLQNQDIEKSCLLSDLTLQLLSEENPGQPQIVNFQDILNQVSDVNLTLVNSSTDMINYQALIDVAKKSMMTQINENTPTMLDNGDVVMDGEVQNEEMKLLVCDMCDKSFAKQSELDSHKRIHSGKRPFLCEVCGRGFSQKPALDSHKKLHQGDKPNICFICDKRFADLSELISHQKSHSGAIFDCKTCGQYFSCKYHLTSHVKIHEDGKVFSCNICGKSFKLRRSLIAHETLHIENGPHICAVCNMEFSKLDNFITHKSTHTDGLFECDICKKRFKSRHHLKTHQSIDAVHKPIICGVCNQEFCRLNKLVSHQTTHTGGKFLCEVCGRGFKQRGALQTHQSVDVEHKPIICNVCNKEFCRLSLLVAHQVTHTGGRFQCETCGRGFKQRGQLVAHQKTFKDEAPQICDTCGQSFCAIRQLNRHKLTHTGRKKFECDVCKERFDKKVRLLKHSKKHNAEALKATAANVASEASAANESLEATAADVDEKSIVVPDENEGTDNKTVKSES